MEALKAELQEINATLIPIQKRSKISGFFKATDDAKVIKSYIPRLERALLDYQVPTFDFVVGLLLIEPLACNDA